jgi:hypothetical protein
MSREGGTASMLADILHRIDQALRILFHYSSLKDQGGWMDTSKLAGLFFVRAFGGEVVSQHISVGGVRRVIVGCMLQLMETVSRRRGWWGMAASWG